MYKRYQAGTCRPKKMIAVFVALIIIFLFPPELHAAQVPAKLAVRILFKALSYDKKLVKRCPDGLRIGVVAIQDNAQSIAESKAMLAAILGVSSMHIRGLTIRAELLLVSSVDDLKAVASEHKVNTLYLSRGWNRDAQKMIIKMSKTRHWLLLTRTHEQVKNGVSLGVYVKDGKPKIAIHARAALELGARFDSGLLSIAEVYK